MSALDIALEYLRRGWSPVPIPYKTKAPLDKGWPAKVVTEENAHQYFNGEAQNIGVRLGELSGGLADVDLDAGEAVGAAPYFLQPTLCFGRPGKPRSHWLYQSDLWQTEDKAAIRFTFITGTGEKRTTQTILELRAGGGGKGAQTVFPGSVHETGELITWGEKENIARVEGDSLKQRCARAASAALLAAHFPSKGARHDAGLTIGGFLSRCGFSRPDTELFAEAVTIASGQPIEKVKDVRKAAREAWDEGNRPGGRSRGFPALAETFGDDVAKHVATWLGFSGETHESVNAEGAPEPPPPLRIINLASLAGKEVPLRGWLVPEVIPANQVTMLFGNGGDGKSLLALQLSVAVAAGIDWIGYLPELGTVLYCSAEDEPDEIHRRVADIIAGRDDLSFEGLGGINVVDLSTLDALLAVPQGRTGTLATTPLFKQIEDKVTELRPRLLVIDALADVYGGDENIRGQVRQFIGFLRHLAFEHRVTVLLIAHPSLSGIASGSGTSGSTGWNNSVRGRLYLEPAPADKGDEPDPYLRKLTIMKNNRGPKGASVPLRWERGRFVLMGGMGSFEQMAADSRAESLFMRLLKAATGQGRTVSPWSGKNYAPTVFADMPDAGGTKAARFKAAMERLLKDGKILALDEGPPSKRRTVLVET
jgi:RecA-family ATPase